MVGFTRGESAVLLFLVISFVVGVGIWTYRYQWAPLPTVSEEIPDFQSLSEDSLDEKDEADAGRIESDPQISLNRASQEYLERLPGVGPVIAGRIVEYRKEYGDFQSIEELVKVKGVGLKTLEKLKPYVKLN